MYANPITAGFTEYNPKDTVKDVIKHFSWAFGYIGLAECLIALTGKHHGESEESYALGLKIIRFMSDYVKESRERLKWNAVLYSTPAEGCTYTLMKIMQNRYGIIKNITDKEFITNSYHIPVWYEISAAEKMEKELPFALLSTGGNIVYVEFNGSGDVEQDEVIYQRLVDHAMRLGIPYFAINVIIDECTECGFNGIIRESCPTCGNSNEDKLNRLRRVTGYLSRDFKRHFNKGKIQETLMRVKHA